ncbi:MAG: outer membrane lipoprotein-sorting protein [Armatimonadetes bacterium]|nr:outer membrane lipoprotein-sorting protein [Armatimonadota bacterium]
MLAALLFLVLGVIFAPRRITNISADQILNRAVAANAQEHNVPLHFIKSELRDGIIPTLEGRATFDGRPIWPIRLKPTDRRYPWMEVWVEQDSYRIVAWRIWDRRGRKPFVAQQSPAADSIGL